MSKQIMNIRQQNYEIAESILNGSYLKSQQRQKAASVVNKEMEKIADLDDQYQKASIFANASSQNSKEQISNLEAKINSIGKLEEKLETAINSINQNRDKDKNVTQKEIAKDIETYTTATNLLNERIQKAQEKLDSIQQTLDNFEPDRIMHNPQAQELLLQLRALLSAQEKELRSLGAH